MITVAVGAEDLRLRFVLLQGKENDEFLTAVLAGIFKARHMHLPGILRKGHVLGSHVFPAFPAPERFC